MTSKASASSKMPRFSLYMRHALRIRELTRSTQRNKPPERRGRCGHHSQSHGQQRLSTAGGRPLLEVRSPSTAATPLCVLAAGGGPCDVKGKDGVAGKLPSENCQGTLHCFTLIPRTPRAGHPCRRNPVQEKQTGDVVF